MLMWLRALSHEGCRQANRLAGRQAEAGGQAAQVEVLRARIICFVMWSVMCSVVSYVVSYVVSWRRRSAARRCIVQILYIFLGFI